MTRHLHAMRKALLSKYQKIILLDVQIQQIFAKNLIIVVIRIAMPTEHVFIIEPVNVLIFIQEKPVQII